MGRLKRSPLKRGKGLSPVSKKRKAYRASATGKAASSYMGAVATLPCVICGATPVDVHHCIHDRYGTARASDFDTIPLCHFHHRHPFLDAIHTSKTGWREKYGPDYGYIPHVRNQLRALGFPIDDWLPS